MIIPAGLVTPRRKNIALPSDPWAHWDVSVFDSLNYSDGDNQILGVGNLLGDTTRDLLRISGQSVIYDDSILNGLSLARVVGYAMRMPVANFVTPPSTPFSFIGVVEMNATGVLNIAVGTAADPRYLWSRSAANKQYCHFGATLDVSPYTNSYNSTPATTSPLPTLLAVVIDGANSVFRTTGPWSSGEHLLDRTFAGNAGTKVFTAANFNLGYIRFGEMLLYDRALTTKELDNAFKFFMNKWIP